MSVCHYQRTIKQAINKILKNKSAVNFTLAAIIAEYSHKSLVTPGSNLISQVSDFFVVKQILSPQGKEHGDFFRDPQ